MKKRALKLGTAAAAGGKSGKAEKRLRGPPYRCAVCTKSFPNRNRYNYHLKKTGACPGTPVDPKPHKYVGNRYYCIHKVWSLNQFYSVDFSKSRIGVKKCVFSERTIKVFVRCC